MMTPLRRINGVTTFSKGGHYVKTVSYYSNSAIIAFQIQDINDALTELIREHHDPAQN